MSAISYIERLLQAKDSLPEVRKRIFEVVYLRGSGADVAAMELGLSRDDFDREHGAMLRSLRGAAANV